MYARHTIGNNSKEQRPQQHRPLQLQAHIADTCAQPSRSSDRVCSEHPAEQLLSADAYFITQYIMGFNVARSGIGMQSSHTHRFQLSNCIVFFTTWQSYLSQRK